MFEIRIEESGNTSMEKEIQQAVGDLRDAFAAIGVRIAENSSRRIRQRPSYRPPLAPGRSLSTGGISVSSIRPSSVEIGAVLPYAEIQHEGGLILPREGKLLAIPVKDTLRAMNAGADGQQGTGWPRDVDPDRTILRFIPSRTGRSVGVLVDEEGKAGHGTGVLYVLVQSTTILGQPYLFDRNDLFAEDWDITFEILEDHIRLKVG